MPPSISDLFTTPTAGNPESPLASKLLKSVLSVYLLIALVVTILQLALEYREEQDRLYEELNQVAEAFLPVLTTSLWNLDGEQLEQTTDGMWVNSAIGRVEITDDLNERLVSRNRETRYLGFSSSTLPWYEYNYAINYSDNFQSDQNIGRLVLGGSSLVVFQRATSTFIYTIINAIIKTLVLWLFFYYALVKLVSKPLHKLTQSVQLINPDSRVETNSEAQNLSELHTDDELGDLAKSFTELETALVHKNVEIEDRQQNLEYTVEELKKVSNAKSVFLAHMSHELRTPLNGIMGMIEFLNDTNLDQQQIAYLSTLSKSGDQLLSVINNVLDFSKIESGKLELELEEFNLHLVVKDCLASFKLLAEKKGLKLTLEYGANKDLRVLGDSIKLVQILNNLVGNAIKFTSEGTVKVGIHIENTGFESHCFFSVQDTGIGISPEKQSQLFESFAQGDKSTTRRFGGTGLGLAISKQLVDFMGGSISVDTEREVGSTFEFDLKFQNCQNKVKQKLTKETDNQKNIALEVEKNEKEYSSLKVLVAEDNPVNQMVIDGLLKKLGIKADHSVDGKNALTKCTDAGDPYDVVLMDIEMPEMDGWEATREIRKNNICSASGKPLKIVGLSAHALNIKPDLARERGMDAYLSKPINLQDLSSVLSEVSRS
ncbi:MAG: response regulator [Pseudomonadales bacterium]|nr:response regulator [Pseudomonadales bacterium]